MASKAYEGNLKAWLLAAEPADWLDDEAPEITEAELGAGTRLLRLVSDGGISYQFTTNTASQARIDDGVVGHNIGTREVTGVSVTHEMDFPLSADAMYGLYTYGSKWWLVVSPDGDIDDLSDGDILNVFEIETGEKQLISPSRDTIQNFTVGFAVQQWNLDVEFAAT